MNSKQVILNETICPKDSISNEVKRADTKKNLLNFKQESFINTQEKKNESFLSSLIRGYSLVEFEEGVL